MIRKLWLYLCLAALLAATAVPAFADVPAEPAAEGAFSAAEEDAGLSGAEDPAEADDPAEALNPAEAPDPAPAPKDGGDAATEAPKDPNDPESPAAETGLPAGTAGSAEDGDLPADGTSGAAEPAQEGGDLSENSNDLPEDSEDLPADENSGAPADALPEDGSADGTEEETEGGSEDGSAEDAALLGEGEEDPAQDAETLTRNGIPAVSLTIDPEELRKAGESGGNAYLASGGSIRIDVPEGYSSEFGTVDPAACGTELALDYLRGDGEFNGADMKNSYKIKLSAAADLLGMGADKNWVLQSASVDNSLLRSRLVTYMARSLGMEYTPASLPVDLYVNGEYRGSYLLKEEVLIGGNRVAIDPSGTDLTGGYLLTFPSDPESAGGNGITTEKGITFLSADPAFSGGYPDQAAGSQAQRDYLAGYLQKTENAVYGENFRDEDGVPVSDLLDLTSAAKYWWVKEFVEDGMTYNFPETYLYKKKDGKLYLGPVDDTDLCMAGDEPDGDGLCTTRFDWLDELRAKDPEFQEILRSVWSDYDQVLAGITASGGVLDRYADEIRTSWAENAKLWPPDMEETFDGEVERIRRFIDRRRAAVNATIDEMLTRVFCTVTFMDEADNVISTVTLRTGEVLSDEYFPEPPVKEGSTFAHWEADSGEAAEYMTVFSDTIVRPLYSGETTPGSGVIPRLIVLLNPLPEMIPQPPRPVPPLLLKPFPAPPVVMTHVEGAGARTDPVRTGDPARTGLWTLLLILSLTAMTGAALSRKAAGKAGDAAGSAAEEGSRKRTS